MAIKNALMKKIIILILITGVFIKISAQQPKVGINPTQKEFLKKLLKNKMPDGNIKFRSDATKIGSIKINNWMATVMPQAKFSHKNQNGDILFLLPQDQMPCIVPDMLRYNYNMPDVKGKMQGNIPNASPKYQIIPKEES
jgi:hypothetical protein